MGGKPKGVSEDELAYFNQLEIHPYSEIFLTKGHNLYQIQSISKNSNKAFYLYPQDFIRQATKWQDLDLNLTMTLYRLNPNIDFRTSSDLINNSFSKIISTRRVVGTKCKYLENTSFKYAEDKPIFSATNYYFAIGDHSTILMRIKS